MATNGVMLLIGTTKGSFTLRSGGARGSWTLDGPHLPGQTVYAMAYDGREGRHRIWTSAHSFHFGAVLRSSDDFGKTWSDPERKPIVFPEDTKQSLAQIWQIALGPGEDTLYCGVEPASLFESRDAGQTWSLVRGLFDHPHRPKWQPGGGGLALHTIVPHPSDPLRMTVAISTGGVYRTTDGGASWSAANHGVRADFMPDKHPEFGQCVHKIACNPARPDTLFLQNHWGLYRSDDSGAAWRDVANGVPSDFGFAMATHPREADTVYIVPLHSDGFRCVPEGKLRVYRTRDGGSSWHPLAKGLPQENAFETVLRDGLATDALKPAGVYFGTRSGKVYGSRDDGDSWTQLVDGLPPVVCVKAVTLTDGPGVAFATSATKAKKSGGPQRVARGGQPKTTKRSGKMTRRPAGSKRKPAKRR
jgi:photosystem II stability/assembly factor-like uncharacterized protein